MRSCERAFCVLAVLSAMVILLLGAFGASEAFGGSLSNSFNMGDISGGFNTSSYPNWGDPGTYAQLSAYIGGQHKINNCGVSMYPQYWYEYDDKGHFLSKTQHGYQVSAYISGEITGSLTLADIGNQNQSNQFLARGLSINESSNISVYKTFDSEQTQPLYSWANASANILDFVVESANGHYNEWSNIGIGVVVAAAGPVIDPVTYFNYNVTWYGDFVPGTLSNDFVAPTMTSSVPEPSTLVLLVSLGIAGIALSIWRRRKA